MEGKLVSGVIVDTDCIIDFFNNYPETASIVERLIKAKLIHISILSIYELYCGAKTKHQHFDIEKISSVSKIEYIDEKIAKEGAFLYQTYRKNGFTLSTVDCLIMATAKVNNLTILTRNLKHYPEKELIYVKDFSES